MAQDGPFSLTLSPRLSHSPADPFLHAPDNHSSNFPRYAFKSLTITTHSLLFVPVRSNNSLYAPSLLHHVSYNHKHSHVDSFKLPTITHSPPLPRHASHYPPCSSVVPSSPRQSTPSTAKYMSPTIYYASPLPLYASDNQPHFLHYPITSLASIYLSSSFASPRTTLTPFYSVIDEY